MSDMTGRAVGEAATDGAMFAARTAFKPWAYQRHVERPRYQLLSRGEAYTTLCLVRVVRCAWLETFAPRCAWEETTSGAPAPQRCKLHEGHSGACQYEEAN